MDILQRSNIEFYSNTKKFCRIYSIWFRFIFVRRNDIGRCEFREAVHHNNFNEKLISQLSIRLSGGLKCMLYFHRLVNIIFMQGMLHSDNIPEQRHICQHYILIILQLTRCFITGRENDLYQFDPKTTTWTELTQNIAGQMPTAREEGGYSTANGRLFIFGGIDSQYGGCLSSSTNQSKEVSTYAMCCFLASF